MYWLWVIITALLCIIGIICFVFTIVLCFDGDKNFIWLVLGAISFIIASGFSANRVRSIREKQEPKYITISTSTLPKIDTTITYSMGKVDTVYTYYFMMED